MILSASTGNGEEGGRRRRRRGGVWTGSAFLSLSFSLFFSLSLVVFLVGAL
jgi:hypothetical protein